jgi:hypothetical protein
VTDGAHGGIDGTTLGGGPETADAGDRIQLRGRIFPTGDRLIPVDQLQISLSTPEDILSINFPSVDYSDYCVKTKISIFRISSAGTEYGESGENTSMNPSQQHLRSPDRSMRNDDSIVSTGSQERRKNGVAVTSGCRK